MCSVGSGVWCGSHHRESLSVTLGWDVGGFGLFIEWDDYISSVGYQKVISPAKKSMIYCVCEHFSLISFCLGLKPH